MLIMTLTVMMITAMVMTPLIESILTLGAVLLAMAVGSTILVTTSLGSWFGFILFLMYITGMLVLFSYMLAMTPNNQYTTTTSAKLMGIIIMIPMTTLTLKSKMNSIIVESKSSMENDIIQLYLGTSMNTYWLLAVTLLVALLMAVKLCYKSPKPLRQYLH